MPLLKSHISTIELYSEAWKTARLGKFTSSNAWKLMSPKGFGETGMQYIRERVYEELSGVSAQKEFENEDTMWGHKYEPEALNEFGLKMGIKFLMVGKLIANPDSRFGGTPDGIWLQNEMPEYYNVFPVEAKCYQGNNHIKICECNNPADVKDKDAKLYWQILDQMDAGICDSLRGYTVNYHPLLKVGGLKIIEYKKIDLIEEFKFMHIRKQQAEKEFNRIRDMLLKN